MKKRRLAEITLGHTQRDYKSGAKQEELKPRMPRSTKVSMVAMLSATSIALSYALYWIPNIELTSLMIFLSGFALGSRNGIVVGLITELVFSNLNPLGPAPPAILLAQVSCMMLIGTAGGAVAKFSDQGDIKLSSSLKMGAMGLYLTILYDLVTDLGFALSFPLIGNDLVSTYVTYLVLGSPFMIVHVFSNTLLFGTIGPLASHYMVKMIQNGGAYR
jgi:uncharacterized membrane protein